MSGSRRSVFLIAALAVIAVAAGPARAVTPAERLAGALRFRTISHEDPADFDPAPFLAFHTYLEHAFPRVHAQLRREVVGGYSLLYTWRGTDPSADPILLTSHQDVVPVEPGSRGDWHHAPFGGEIADGYVWGRGAIDDKGPLLATLEAVEGLLAQGFQPRRTIYLAFGHDEEVGGSHGAAAITELLRSRGVRLWFSLDEGMAVLTGLGLSDRPIGMIGVAEKGFLTLDLTAHAEGGHSSIPRPGGAVTQLAAAISRLDASPMPPRPGAVAMATFDALLPVLSGIQRFAVEHRRIFRPLIVRALLRDPTTAATLRTTTAFTMLRAGVKENVLPREATATVNFRLVPGDTVDEVVAHVREAVADPDIGITVKTADEASGVSSSTGPAFQTLADALRKTMPDVAVVAPALVVGGTDSKHYGEVAENAYRFAPMRMGPADRARFHGVDERLGEQNYREMIAFYGELLRRAAGSGAR